MRTVPNWMSAGIVFVSILAVHLWVGAGQARVPEIYSGWIDKVGLSFDAAVIKAVPDSVYELPRPSIRAPAAADTAIFKNAQQF